MKQKQVRGDVDPTVAREQSLAYLDIQRRRLAAHRAQGDQLALAGGYFIRTARLYGLPWADVAHALGISVWAARRAARKAPR